MPALKEIRRSACVAWSPSDSHKTLLALGGRGVGAQLDIVNINLADSSRRGYEVRLPLSLFLLTLVSFRFQFALIWVVIRLAVCPGLWDKTCHHLPRSVISLPDLTMERSSFGTLLNF